MARERYRRCVARKAAGIVGIVLHGDALWLAETLNAAGGFGGADEDDRAKLEAATQALLDFLIGAARTERRLIFPETDLP